MKFYKLNLRFIDSTCTKIEETSNYGDYNGSLICLKKIKNFYYLYSHAFFFINFLTIRLKCQFTSLYWCRI